MSKSTPTDWDVERTEHIRSAYEGYITFARQRLGMRIVPLDDVHYRHMGGSYPDDRYYAVQTHRMYEPRWIVISPARLQKVALRVSECGPNLATGCSDYEYLPVHDAPYQQVLMPTWWSPENRTHTLPDGRTITVDPCTGEEVPA